ncbi:hypothetical protein [uncultured Brevundimonas sp.]|uniref:hypothetical protein n=1 Tax=uncultured Brevundimonas sp. TaxID=213418 RepID=UPI0025F49538|nr:hypothetical protein [uncultured Brevundimonas sp.]
MDIKDVFPADGRSPRNYCDNCNGHLDLAYADFEEIVSGVEFRVYGLPVLRCPVCAKDHLPDRSRFLIIHSHEQCTQSGTPEFVANRRKIEQDFGFTTVPFLYDPDDYHYIPGLQRDWDEGFLTPVFFKRSVLLKYDNAPGYRVRFASTTYGDIDTGRTSFPFGINRHGNVVMWLGDIAKLPVEEQYYLRSENLPSDHSIGSEFYDGQIECIFTARAREDELFRLRSNFIEACFLRFGKKVAHLDAEVMELALSFNGPVVDTDKERRHVADTLNKLYIESLDNGALGEVMTSLGGDPKKLGSLKRLQGLLELASPGADVATVLSPLYVLYDLRVAYSHLTSAATGQEILKKVTDRLALARDADLPTIYVELVDRLSATFEALTALIETPAADEV